MTTSAIYGTAKYDESYYGMVQKDLNSDSYIKKPANENTINSDMFIGYFQEKTLVSNSYIQRTYNTQEDIFNTNLQAYYKYNNDILDYSGNGYVATPNNLTYASGKINNAGSFNGTSTYVLIEHGGDLQFKTGNFTAMCWANASSFAGFGGLISVDISGDNSWKIFRDNSETHYKARFSSFSLSFNSVSTEEWHHYAMVKSGTTLTIYQDGIYVNSGTCPASHSLTGTQMVLGSYRINDAIAGNNLLHGLQDEVRIYNSALTAEEILAIASMFMSNTHIKKLATEQTLTTDIFIGYFQDETLNSNYYIKKLATEKTINSNVYILKPGTEGSIPSDSFLGYLAQTKTIVSNAQIKKLAEKIINSDFYIKKLATEKIILSDMFIGYLAQTKTINSNAYIKKLANENTINSNSYIKFGDEGSIISNLVIKSESNKNISSNSQIAYVGNTLITYPVSGIRYVINDSNERITFDIPTAKSNIDIQLQLSKVSDYATKVLDISSYHNVSIWEYYDGAAWQEWPSDGVPNTYSGNGGRVNIYGLVSYSDLPFLYIRMRGIIRS